MNGAGPENEVVVVVVGHIHRSRSNVWPNYQPDHSRRSKHQIKGSLARASAGMVAPQEYVRSWMPGCRARTKSGVEVGTVMSSSCHNEALQSITIAEGREKGLMSRNVMGLRCYDDSSGPTNVTNRAEGGGREPSKGFSQSSLSHPTT